MLAQVAVLLAGFLTAITGFGFNAVSLPLLAVAFEPHHAVVVGLLVGLLIFVLVFALPGVRAEVDVRLVLVLFVSSLPGLPLGALALTWLDARTLRLIIGGLTFVYATAQLLNRQPPMPRTRRAAPAIGFVSGVLSSSVSLGGTPIMLYLLRLDSSSPRELRATAVAFVILSTVASIGVLYWSTDLVNAGAVHDAALLLPAALVGFVGGAVVFRYIRPAFFVRLTLVTLAAVGLFALVVALKDLASG